jgi:glycosyltransferase involved in cell wall biosynthesis
MKVLFVWHAAVEPEYQKLFVELSKEVEQLIAIAPSSWTEGGRLQYLENKKIDLDYSLIPLSVIFRNKGKGHFYPNFFKIISIVKTFKPDVLHLFEEPFSFVCSEFISIFKMFSPNTKIIIESFENLDVVQRNIFHYIQKFNLKNTDLLINIPQKGELIWRSRGFRGYIKKGNVGVDTKKFFKNYEFLKNKERLRIGYVGRVTPEKGLDTLIKAFLALINGGFNFELSVVGSGNEDYVNKLKNKLNMLILENKVFFEESLDSDDLVSLYNKIDILVLPSLTTLRWKEQFGRVLIEAMACETVVVGSSSGEIPVVIGDAGVVFKEGDADDLFLKLKELILNPNLMEELAKKGKERVDKLYSWEVVAKQLKEYYLDLLKQ